MEKKRPNMRKRYVIAITVLVAVNIVALVGLTMRNKEAPIVGIYDVEFTDNTIELKEDGTTESIRDGQAWTGTWEQTGSMTITVKIDGGPQNIIFEIMDYGFLYGGNTEHQGGTRYIRRAG